MSDTTACVRPLQVTEWQHFGHFALVVLTLSIIVPLILRPRRAQGPAGLRRSLVYGQGLPCIVQTTLPEGQWEERNFVRKENIIFIVLKEQLVVKTLMV